MASTANRVIKNTGYLYMKMGITMFISLYTTRLVLNSLGASDFGIFNIVGGAIAMLGFLNASMASATQRFMSYSEGEGNIEKQKRIFNISIILHLMISLFVGLALLVSGYYFFNGILNIPCNRLAAAQVVYGSLVVSTMFTVMTVPYDAVMNAHENMKYYAIVGILESLLKLLVAFACVYTSYDKLIVYGILMACIPFITLTIMRVYCHKTYKECDLHPIQYFDNRLAYEMSCFAGWNFMTAFTSMVTQYGLSIVLNHFWGTILNTAQGIANQLSGQLMAFSNSMLKALNPVIAKSQGGGNVQQMLNVSLLGAKFSFIILLIFSVPFILEASFILKLWLKQIPEWAVLFCQLQLLRSLTEQLTITIESAIKAHGNIKSMSIINSFLYILPIILTAISFYYNYPPYFMYVIWIVCWGILKGITSLYYCNKLCGLSYITYLRMVFIPCLLLSVFLILIGAIPVSLMDQSVHRLIVTIFFTTFGSFFLCWFIILKSEERCFIEDNISKIRDKFFKK